jgi:hypothetical protein
LDEAHTEILFDTKFMPNVLEILFPPMTTIRIATFACQKGGYPMKRALIGTIGVVALIPGVRTFMRRRVPQDRIPAGNGTPASARFAAAIMCVADVDINRGYGFLKPCPAPQAPARRAAR